MKNENPIKVEYCWFSIEKNFLAELTLPEEQVYLNGYTMFSSWKLFRGKTNKYLLKLENESHVSLIAPPYNAGVV